MIEAKRYKKRKELIITDIYGETLHKLIYSDLRTLLQEGVMNNVKGVKIGINIELFWDQYGGWSEMSISNQFWCIYGQMVTLLKFVLLAGPKL